MRITVIGGSGATGSAVVAEAARRGHTVTSVTRSGTHAEGATADVVADLADTPAVVDLVDAADATIIAVSPDRTGGPVQPVVDAFAALVAARPAGRLVVVGGGVEAIGVGHIFASLGSRVTLVNRSDRLLRRIDGEIAARATQLAAEHFAVRLNQRLSSVEPAERGGLLLRFVDPSDTEYRYNTDALLVVTGRVPNGDQLAVDRAGVDVDEAGFVVVDEHQRTSREHIWALGDVCDHHLLKHVANAQARVVQHNLLHPDEPIARPAEPVPQAIFGQPPVLTVGATEEALREAGTEYVKVVQPYDTVAYGWALDDRTSFVKLLVDPATRLLLGAGVIGPEAPELGQLLVAAMSFGIDVGTMARGQYWAHPELAEVVENALLAAAAECEGAR